MSERLRILFVAPFSRMRDGGTGGMVSVANNLRKSSLSDRFDLVLMDVGLPSLASHNSLMRRVCLSIGRLARYPRQVASVDCVFVFVSDGTSWLDKGVLVILARWMNRGVVLRPGGAYYDQQCERSRLFRRWVGLVLRHAHMICSQGPRWSAFFNSFPGLSNRVVEVYNPIEIPELRPRSRGVEASFNILHVGWMIPRKGVMEALRVFERVKALVPEATFTLAGGGELLEEFRAKAARFGDCVRVLGWVPKDDVPALLHEADVFLAPARAEGMPNSVLEAMAYAVPVVATRVGSLPDLICHGENGFLTEVDDIDAMVDAVLHLAGDRERAEEIGLNGRKAIEERHDIERCATRIATGLVRAACECHPFRDRGEMLASALGASPVGQGEAEATNC